MRESRLYLNFFKDNLFYLILPAVAFGVAGYFYQVSRPTLYTMGSLYELNNSTQDVNAKIALADEAVTVLRSQNLQSSLGLDEGIELVVFKPGPLSIKLNVNSQDKGGLSRNLDSVQGHLTTNWEVKKIGEDNFYETKPNILFGVLFGAGIGVFLGLVISLTTTYFKKF